MHFEHDYCCMFVGIGKIVLSLTTSMQLLVTQRTWLNGLEEKKKHAHIFNIFCHVVSFKLRNKRETFKNKQTSKKHCQSFLKVLLKAKHPSSHRNPISVCMQNRMHRKIWFHFLKLYFDLSDDFTDGNIVKPPHSLTN